MTRRSPVRRHGGKRPRGNGWTAGMPVGRENPYTPAGELEQLGKFARGARRAAGWRRAARWVIAVVVLLPFLVGLAITVVQHL